MRIPLIQNAYPMLKRKSATPEDVAPGIQISSDTDTTQQYFHFHRGKQ